MFDKIKKLLEGKKTYLTAISAIIGALIGFANGTIDAGVAIQIIITAILGMTLRAGITKSEPK